ncbi:MAG TPA: HPF/RaiA family ribosome-associated protein [Thermoanaerobaculia bacterium]|jgi:putative sigma-54 modulation protein
MQIEFAARHVALDDPLRSLTEERLGRAVRFLREPIEVRVALDGTAGDKRLVGAEVHVVHRHGDLHARCEDVDPREAMTRALTAIEVQAKRARERAVDKRRRASRDAASSRQWPVDVLARESLRSGGTPRIVRSSRFTIEPMTLNQAAMRLDSSRNEFVVFLDAERDKVSVLYKRKDDDYGLIAPEG